MTDGLSHQAPRALLWDVSRETEGRRGDTRGDPPCPVSPAARRHLRHGVSRSMVSQCHPRHGVTHSTASATARRHPRHGVTRGTASQCHPRHGVARGTVSPAARCHDVGTTGFLREGRSAPSSSGSSLKASTYLPMTGLFKRRSPQRTRALLLLGSGTCR